MCVPSMKCLSILKLITGMIFIVLYCTVVSITNRLFYDFLNSSHLHVHCRHSYSLYLLLTLIVYIYNSHLLIHIAPRLPNNVASLERCPLVRVVSIKYIHVAISWEVLCSFVSSVARLYKLQSVCP